MLTTLTLAALFGAVLACCGYRVGAVLLVLPALIIAATAFSLPLLQICAAAFMLQVAYITGLWVRVLAMQREPARRGVSMR
jgi:hypothetical protein